MNFPGQLTEASKQLHELRKCAEDLGFQVQFSGVGEKPQLADRALGQAA
jgi:hypothetical protein